MRGSAVKPIMRYKAIYGTTEFGKPKPRQSLKAVEPDEQEDQS